MTTCGCGKPVNDGFVCSICGKALEIALGNISAYWADLDTVKGQQTRYGERNGARSLEKPLGVDPRFAGLEWVQILDEANETITWKPRIPVGSALVDLTRNTIATWTRIVMDERPALCGPVHASCLHVSCSTIRRSKWPTDTVTGCCRYLLGHADWIRGKEWAPEILDELDHLELQLKRMIDRPADKWFAGPCDKCERDLYAKEGGKTVHCRECDLRYDVADRRKWLLEAAEDHLCNAVLLARAVSWLGSQPLTPSRVRVWAHRGRIAAKGHEQWRGEQRPLYRVGDALDLLASDTQKAG